VDPADDPRLVLARLVESPSDGRGAFSRLVARVTRTASVGGNPSKLVAAPEASSSTLPLAGLVTEGVQLFLRANSPIGFVTGFVRGPSGLGVEGSRVTAAGLGTADLSLTGGRYAVVAPAGAASLTALHPQTNESGTAQIASLTKGDVASVDIVIRPIPPSISAVQPASGAVDQPIGSVATVTFDQALDPASVGTGTLTLGLADSSGNPTGLLFNGTVSLSPDRRTILFTPSRPLPPGARCVASLAGLVRSTAGTPYAGALPYRWRFTVSRVLAPGGQVHPEKIRMIIPSGGTAQVVGDAGALPTVPSGTPPWSVWFDVDGAPACPTVVTTSANASGGFTATAGCPPTAPVTLSSAVYIHVIDSTGGQAATWNLGPFVTADGFGVVAPAGVETVYTTPEGIELTVPAAAFAKSTLVSIRKKPLDPFGVPVPAGLEVGAVLDIDFDGTANETLRLRIPVQTSAPAGRLVVAATAVDLPWGRRLRLVDLGRLVADGSGNKFISTAESDQPTESLLGATKTALATKTQTAPTGCGTIICSVFIQLRYRQSAAFFYGISAELTAVTGNIAPPLLSMQFAVLFNTAADAFVFMAPPFDWSGRFILPSVGGSFSIVRRDQATGWILGETAFTGVAADASRLTSLGTIPTGPSDPPRLVDAAPFSLTFFKASEVPRSQAEENVRLRLEVEAHTEPGGATSLRSVGDFPLAESTWVDLYDLGPKSPGSQRAQVSGGVFATPPLGASAGDELLAVVSPGNVDPESLDVLTLDFSRPLVSKPDPSAYLRLTDCGPVSTGIPGASPVCLTPSAVAADVTQTRSFSRLELRPRGVLAYGHQFKLELVGITSGSDPKKDVYPEGDPSTFFFSTRPKATSPIGSTDPSTGVSSARDLMKFGNILLVGGTDGKIVAYDVTNPADPKPFASAGAVAGDAVRAFATDGHGRLFFASRLGATWAIRAIRLEDVRNASGGSFVPALGGVKVSLASDATSSLTPEEYLSVAGTFPSGIPTGLDLVVKDETLGPWELKTFFENVARKSFEATGPDAAGFYDVSIDVDTKEHLARGSGSSCLEPDYVHTQRVTIDDLTTGQSWSVDVVNGPAGGTAPVAFRARRGDQLRLRYNLSAIGYVAIVGSGISAVDLNRFYDNPLDQVSGLSAARGDQCGRRLGTMEGREIPSFPTCAGAGTGDPWTPPLAWTPAVAALGGPGDQLWVYGVLTRFGSSLVSALAQTPGAMAVAEIRCLRTAGRCAEPFPAFRSVASAIGATWTDRGIETSARLCSDLRYPDRTETLFLRPDPAPTPRTVKGDLLFFSLGPEGVGIFDVTAERRGEARLIGRFQAKGHTVFRLQADVGRNRLYAGGTDEEGKPVIDVWDVSEANGGPWPDGVTPASGSPEPNDRRLVLSLHAAWDADHVALDPSTGLLFTWDNDLSTAGSPSPKGLVLPVDDPRFLFPGRFADGTRLSDAPLVPLGIPLRRSASDEAANKTADETNHAAAFRVRVALPGFLGETLKAKVETLRGLPDSSLLARSDLGLLSAPPAGPGWPDREVFVTLRRLVPAPALPAATYESVYNLYESDETVLLVADLRARKDYQRQAIPGETADEKNQCRRCDLPSFLDSNDPSLRELLAGGPYVRAILAVPPAGDANTQKALDFFAALAGRERAPTGTAPVAAWADSVPSPVQAALAEPARNAAFWSGEAGARVSLVSGEAVLEATDHAVSGRGVGFVFDRTYRSGTAGYGPLGAAGWESSLFARIRTVPLLAEEGAPTLLEFRDGAGRVWSFPPADASGSCPAGWEVDGNGTRCVPKGLQLRLEELPSGAGFQLLSRNNDAMTFDAAGRLTSVSDRQRRKPPGPPDRVNTLRLFYDAGGFAVRAEDEFGRVYRLAYDESPRLSSGLPNPQFGLLKEIVDFADRLVGFEFDDRRRLKKVRLPKIQTDIDGKLAGKVPTMTYGYAGDLLAADAPLHGPDLSLLRLASYRIPGGTMDRIAFEYEGSTGRVSKVAVPPGTEAAKWEFQSATPSTAAPLTAIDVLSPLVPKKLRTKYTIENGRIKQREEVAVETLSDSDPTPGATDQIPTTSLVTSYFYEEDGRLKKTVWPDKSETTTTFQGGDRITRANPGTVTEGRGTAPEGTPRAEEPITTFNHFTDNIPDSASDKMGRETREAVALAQSSGTSGYSAEGTQPAIKATSDFDDFGRLKRATGDGTAGSLTVVAYGADVRGRGDAGFASEITRGGAVKETLEYDDNSGSGRGNVTRRKISFGTWTDIAYDEWDRPIRETSGQSDGSVVEAVADAVTERAYDEAGRLLLERRKQSGVPGDWVETSYTYNDREQVLTKTAKQLAGSSIGAPLVSGTTIYLYDDSGRITDVATPGAMTVHYDYDGAGRVRSERTGTAATSGIRRRGYDPMGRLAFKTDGDIGVWRGRYDAWGRLYREDLPTGAVVEREYDSAGGLKRQTTWDGPPGSSAKKLAESLFHVTAAGEVDRVETLLTESPRTTRVTLKQYDASGRLVGVTSGPTDAIQRTDLAVEYDTADRPTKETDAGLNQVRHDYGEKLPWPVSTTRLEAVPGVVEPVESFRSDFHRDAFGRVVGEDRWGARTLLSQFFTKYDQAGNVRSTRSSVGAETKSTYDGLGRVLSVTRPSGGTSRYAYDGDGRLLFRETSRGGSLVDLTSWKYEDSGTGRLERITWPGAKTESFKYNGDDTVDVRTLRSGIQVQYGWDAANRLTSRTLLNDPGGKAPGVDGGDTYQYDNGSRLLSAKRFSKRGTSDWIENAAAGVGYQQYDAAGRPKIETVGSRPPLTRTFDTWSREAAVGLPAGVGRDPSAASGYKREFDSLDRVTDLSALSGGDPVGATWEWGGSARLWGVTAKGALATAHRFAYPGSGFGTFPGGFAPWKLGRLSVGAPGASAPKVTDPLGVPWGEFLYGYRSGDEARRGRQAQDAGTGFLAGQGWAWHVDNSLRLDRAEVGKGSTEGVGVVPSSDAFSFGYGEMDQLLSATRDARDTPSSSFTAGIAGRIETRNASSFTYDDEGHRISDDRLQLTWGWRDELLAAEVKDPSSPYAGHKVYFEYDALGRLLSRTHAGPLPSGGTECVTFTSTCERPIIEKRRYLWGGGALLAEAGFAADLPGGGDGPLRWRKSYVPGPTGLDDAVQLRVETYDLSGNLAGPARLFSYLRDEQGTVLGLVEEKAGADPQKPPTPVRYLYAPFGEAHAEVGPEVRAVRFDGSLLTVTKPDGTGASQNPGTAAPGALRLTLSTPLDLSTLSSGIMVERRQMDGSWNALTGSQLAIGRSPSIPEEIQILPLSGWEKDATWRVRMTTTLRDGLGRSPDPAAQPTLEMYVPASAAVVYDRSFPLVYDSALASGQTATGTFPGGQPMLFQGAWTDPVTGLQYNRARWYDARNASWLSQDPMGDKDSPNLYGFVGARPHELTDPLGLEGGPQNPTASEWAQVQQDAGFDNLRPSAMPSRGEASIGGAFRKHSSEIGVVVGGMAVTAATEAVIYYTEGKVFELGARVVLRGVTHLFRTLQEATAFARSQGARVRYVEEAASRMPTLSAKGTQFEGATAARSEARTRLAFGEGPESDAVRVTGARGAGLARLPQHHVFPKEHRAFFEVRGFVGGRSIDEFTIALPDASHQAIHGGGNFRLGRTWTEEWNRRIMATIVELEKETGRRLRFEEIMSLGEDMMRRYGLDGPFLPYK
jgi:RHS repeat-associated protein